MSKRHPSCIIVCAILKYSMEKYRWGIHIYIYFYYQYLMICRSYHEQFMYFCAQLRAAWVYLVWTRLPRAPWFIFLLQYVRGFAGEAYPCEFVIALPSTYPEQSRCNTSRFSIFACVSILPSLFARRYRQPGFCCEGSFQMYREYSMQAVEVHILVCLRTI